MSAISVEHLSRWWGQTRAVDDVSFEAAAGRMLVLLGPSGCGKSTTLRLIAGLEAATAGRIAIGGVDVTDRPPAERRVSMVFQSYALFPHLSVAENIVFGLRVRRVGAAERKARLARVADLLGLAALLERRPSQLSGGQQQRVAIARALVHEPALILADEPTGTLDAETATAVLALLDGLAREGGKTVVMVTHSREVVGVADRIFSVKRGHLVEEPAAPGAPARSGG